MTETTLTVEAELPFSWSVGPCEAGPVQGSRLLLRVANQLDQHDQEPDKINERLEAKVDLLLHWLGLHLFGHGHGRITRLRIGQDTVEWISAEVPPAGVGLVLDLVIHPALAAPLRLPARLIASEAGQVRAELLFPDEEFADAWGQWLFRLHRRAIQEAKQRTATAG